MELIKRFTINTKGVDYACGDVHGCFSKLEAKLLEVGFNPNTDRLFLAGDLVDRGPESIMAVEWLSRPYIHSIRGNHEELTIHHGLGISDGTMHFFNGGQWFINLSEHDQKEIARIFDDLPYIIEVETSEGTVGIVHADPACSNWTMLAEIIANQEKHEVEYTLDMLLWSRRLVYSKGAARVGVQNVRAVVCGHTPVNNPTIIDNVYFIDTGACFDDGYFTLLRLDTLEVL